MDRKVVITWIKKTDDLFNNRTMTPKYLASELYYNMTPYNRSFFREVAREILVMEVLND